MSEGHVDPTAWIDESALLCGRIRIESAAQIRAGVIFVDCEDRETNVRHGVEIGEGCIIGSGVDIGEGAVLRPGSVVLMDVPAHAVIAGNPASVVGYTPRMARVEANEVSTAKKLAVQQLGVGGASLFRFPVLSDLRGSLSAVEFDEHFPFLPRRQFSVFGVPSEEIRGEHAHRECHQLLICLHGSCRAIVDDGRAAVEVDLDSPGLALYMPPMLWGTQYRYSSDSVLSVFASHAYDPADYIRDYRQFTKEVG